MGESRLEKAIEIERRRLRKANATLGGLSGTLAAKPPLDFDLVTSGPQFLDDRERLRLDRISDFLI